MLPFSHDDQFSHAHTAISGVELVAIDCEYIDIVLTMEVASPLTFLSPSAGTKRGLSCSPQLMETTNHPNSPDGDLFQRSHKRRRFHADTSVESLSSAFAAPSSFFNNPLQSQQGLGSPFGMCLLD